MSKWMTVRTKTERARFDSVRSKIMGYPEKVAKERYWPQLEQIAQDGVDYIRYIIATSETRTGQERANRGMGAAGRIDSGDMFDKVGARIRERKTGFSAFVGWIYGKPGYSIFQEQGTKRGVQGMHALEQAREYMLSELRAMIAGKFVGNSNIDPDSPN